MSLGKNIPIIKENLNRVMFFGCMDSKLLQSYPTLCNPMDSSPPSFSIHEILQARILEWAAIPFSRGSSWPRDGTPVSCIVGRCFTVWATREGQKEEQGASQIWLLSPCGGLLLNSFNFYFNPEKYRYLRFAWNITEFYGFTIIFHVTHGGGDLVTK